MNAAPAISPFIPPWYILRPFAGEIILICTIAAILLVPFFTPRKSNAPCACAALIGLLFAFYAQLHVGAASGELFNGMLISDGPAVYYKAILYLFTAGIVLMWFAATSNQMRQGDAAEFFVLLLGATLGMALMSETSNLLMIFLALELASLPSYVLAGFHKTERLGAEASLKYVLFGSACSAIMIFGLSYLYGIGGSLQFADFLHHTPVDKSEMLLGMVGLLCVLAGVGFKIAMVPLHFWCPDVFEGAGIDIAAFLSVASKGAGLMLLMRVMGMIGVGDLAAEVAGPVGIIVGVLGAVTATVANAAALGQTNVKRLLAYSSIAHAGYMLCVLPLVVSGPRDTAVQAILIYLTVYMFMNLGAFMVAALVERAGAGTQIADYAGLGRRAPAMAVCMTIFLFSLIGLPPLAGFIAKLNVMWLLGAAGSGWWILVAIIAANTVLSVYYYAKIIRAMYFTTSEAKAGSVIVNPLGAGIIAICSVMLVMMLIFYATLSRVVAHFVM
ncbi:MAG TPA: NADH-quinone oxidoreductase subunit N [Tepidisphaeraceae bacterium]|jgi:NADH-quinone oxidoreductase subunit N